jgi:hypothetical protein
LLNDAVEYVKVLEYAACNDARQTLLQVPRSLRKYLFSKNAIRTGWIDKIIYAVLPEEWDANEQSVDDDEDKIGTNNLSIVAWVANSIPGEYVPR